MKGSGDRRKQNIITAHPATSAQEPALIESDRNYGKEDIVTIAGQDSFPASDPPAWTLGHEPRTD